jgi:hypothetical protein
LGSVGAAWNRFDIEWNRGEEALTFPRKRANPFTATPTDAFFAFMTRHYSTPERLAKKWFNSKPQMNTDKRRLKNGCATVIRYSIYGNALT